MNEKGLLRSEFRRRDFLAGTAVLLLSGGLGRASTISGQLPWQPNAGDPPVRVKAGPWLFFSRGGRRAAKTQAAPVLSTVSWPGLSASRMAFTFGRRFRPA